MAGSSMPPRSFGLGDEKAAAGTQEPERRHPQGKGF